MISAGTRVPGVDPCVRGPTVVEAPLCFCGCPADEDGYCCDDCRDLDESRREVAKLEAEIAGRIVGGDFRMAVHRAEHLGAYRRHLHDLELGEDGAKVSGAEYEAKLLEAHRAEARS
jgi:hypothetical protein